MLENIATIITDVRRLLDESSANFWTDDAITDWANEGMEEIAHETFCLRTWKTYTILADDIFDEREFRMDDDFIAIDEGLIYYNDKAIYPTSMRKLVNQNPKWRDKEGTPSAYYVRGDMLGFNRKITAGDTVKFYQIERAATMSGDVEPFNGDYRLINFRKLIRDYALAFCWWTKGEDNRGDRAWMRYLNGVEKMKDLLNIDMDSSYNVIPEDNPGHMALKKRFPDWNG